nr:MAG TPA: hypothetical protein [Caudoviricetes sp.]
MMLDWMIWQVKRLPTSTRSWHILHQCSEAKHSRRLWLLRE